MRLHRCAWCGYTHNQDTWVCTDRDRLEAEVKRLQSEVQRMQACALPSEGAYISGRVDGERIGFAAGQEAMRERCAQWLEQRGDHVWAKAIRALEVE